MARAPKYCPVTDCYNLTTNRYCDEHRSHSWNTHRSPSSHQTGTRAWRRIRAEVLNRDSHTCVIRGPRCIVQALEVDHVVPCYLGGDNTMGNLQSVCPECHLDRTKAQARAARG